MHENKIDEVKKLFVNTIAFNYLRYLSPNMFVLVYLLIFNGQLMFASSNSHILLVFVYIK